MVVIQPPRAAWDRRRSGHARTAPGRSATRPLLMLLYNNVAGLRQFLGSGAPGNAGKNLSAAGPDHLDVQIADFLAQGVAVEPQQVGSPDLIATGGSQSCREQWILNLAQDAVVQAGRRQAVIEGGEIAR